MNKFDYILYIEFKLSLIGFWCVIFFEKKGKKENKSGYINLATKLNR